jgi:signal transduction histidine kinase/ActR/RegA family two-component response regulator
MQGNPSSATTSDSHGQTHVKIDEISSEPRAGADKRGSAMDKIRARPAPAIPVFLLIFAAAIYLLHGRMGDGALALCNLLPLLFALIYGMRWGVFYAVIHSVFSVFLSDQAGFMESRLRSNGFPSMLVAIVLSAGIGRIRDLTLRLQHELAERKRYEQELKEQQARLESLVAERTADLVASNNRLVQEMAEHQMAEAQKRTLEASLKRAEKMEAMGLLAGSVAHDLNNILSSLIGYPDLLIPDLPLDSPVREALIDIQESGQRASAVVQDLLTMARRTVRSVRTLDLNKIVFDVMRSAELSALRARHPDVSIITKLATEPLPLHGSAIHLNRAVLNLVLNAMEAIEGKGQITLTTCPAFIDTPSRRYEVVTEGQYVTLTVEDTGQGIAHADLDRIFEPFYTKKVMGRSGSGLGMAIVWGTLKDHNGYIDVRSEQGKGTTFTLYLPATGEVPQEDDVPFRTEDYMGRGESLLVVDDVSMQRDLCVAMLKKLGYAAEAVPSGEAAVEYVHRKPVELLVLDMIMDPGIDGLETYRRIRAANPGQKAVIASGFSESEQVLEAQRLGAGAYLRKPYTLERLAVAVKHELQKAGGTASKAGGTVSSSS